MHEQRVRSLLVEHLPDVSVSLSIEVSPEMREYERFTTTCVNAYVQPLVAGYLARLENDLEVSGFSCQLFLMLSSGGITTAEPARAFPVRLVESGPACYGRGGLEPTVTDADVVLGRIDTRFFAGGRVPLHPELAQAAMARAD